MVRCGARGGRFPRGFLRAAGGGGICEVMSRGHIRGDETSRAWILFVCGVSGILLFLWLGASLMQTL